MVEKYNSRWQKFPSHESKIVQKLMVSKNLKHNLLYLFKTRIAFWLYDLAIINKPSFPGICSVCYDPNFSTGLGENEIIQGNCGKKDGLNM